MVKLFGTRKTVCHLLQQDSEPETSSAITKGSLMNMHMVFGVLIKIKYSGTLLYFEGGGDPWPCGDQSPGQRACGVYTPGLLFYLIYVVYEKLSPDK